jgi:hypothetical protein
MRWGGVHRNAGWHCREASIGGKGAGRPMGQGDGGAGMGCKQERGGSSRVVVVSGILQSEVPEVVKLLPN